MIRTERCPCGHSSCRDTWLVGAGKFVEGSGFEPREAQLVADLLNARTMEDYERIAVRRALEEAEGCMSQAARILGVGRSTLYRWTRSHENPAPTQ